MKLRMLGMRALLGGVVYCVTAAAAPPATLTLNIENMRSTRGNVLVCVTAQARHFPDCRDDPSARRITVAAARATGLIIPDLAPGDYAVALIHDENANGKLDTRLMIPVEGFGFSRNPPIAFGPPRFSAAEFVLQHDQPQTVRMKYML